MRITSAAEDAQVMIEELLAPEQPGSFSRHYGGRFF
jgi:hypothetical protein